MARTAEIWRDLRCADCLTFHVVKIDLPEDQVIWYCPECRNYVEVI